MGERSDRNGSDAAGGGLASVAADVAAGVVGEHATAAFASVGILAGPGGAAAGSVVGAAVRAAVGPTPADRALADADLRIAIEETYANPRTRARVDDLERTAAGQGARLLALEAYVSGSTADGAHALLAQIVHEADQRGVNWEDLRGSRQFCDASRAAFWRALEITDPAVLPPLARLVLAFRDRAVDPYFRSIGRTLVDLGAAELGDLDRLVRAIDRTIATAEGWPGPNPAQYGRLVLRRRVLGFDPTLCLDSELTPVGASGSLVVFRQWPPFATWPTLASALRRAGVFDRSPFARVPDHDSPEEVDHVERETLSVLRGILRPEPT